MSIGILAQDSNKVKIFDSSFVLIRIDEFQHIIAVNKSKNNQDSILQNLYTINDLLKEENQNLLKIDSLKEENISNLKRYIKETEQPFYDTFWFGALTMALSIIGAFFAF